MKTNGHLVKHSSELKKKGKKNSSGQMQRFITALCNIYTHTHIVGTRGFNLETASGHERQKNKPKSLFFVHSIKIVGRRVYERKVSAAQKK
jgi:hypothetical protein